MGWGERQIWRDESGEGQADVNGLLATWVQRGVQAWTIAKDQVFVWGPEAAKEGCVDICDSYHHWGQCEGL